MSFLFRPRNERHATASVLNTYATDARRVGSRDRASMTKTRPSEAGMTLLELVIACAILVILASAALPVARNTIIRSKEYELRRGLREMRDAIDRYKDTADRNLIRVQVGSEGYPPDLE